MAEKKHPTTRHNDLPFTADEAMRAERAGQPLKFKAAILYFESGWAEFCERFGYPACASNLRPCFACSAPPDSRMFNPDQEPEWVVNQDADFENACGECENKVPITSADMRDRIGSCLIFDKRQGGSCGRCLDQDLPGEGHDLRRWDRLDPSDQIRDIATFNSITAFPTIVTFWRPAATTLLLFRCPHVELRAWTDPCQRPSDRPPAHALPRPDERMGNDCPVAASRCEHLADRRTNCNGRDAECAHGHQIRIEDLVWRIRPGQSRAAIDSAERPDTQYGGDWKT